MKKINCIMFIMFMIIFISSFSVKATVNNLFIFIVAKTYRLLIIMEKIMEKNQK